MSYTNVQKVKALFVSVAALIVFGTAGCATGKPGMYQFGLYDDKGNPVLDEKGKQVVAGSMSKYTGIFTPVALKVNNDPVVTVREESVEYANAALKEKASAPAQTPASAQTSVPYQGKLKPRVRYTVPVVPTSEKQQEPPIKKITTKETTTGGSVTLQENSKLRQTAEGVAAVGSVLNGAGNAMIGKGAIDMGKAALQGKLGTRINNAPVVEGGKIEGGDVAVDNKFNPTFNPTNVNKFEPTNVFKPENTFKPTIVNNKVPCPPKKTECGPGGNQHGQQVKPGRPSQGGYGQQPQGNHQPDFAMPR